MPQTHNFDQMNLKELRAYVLSHRQDTEALKTYMDRLAHDPNVTHYSGSAAELGHLEKLIQERATKEHS